jgi:hypothetical protein
MFKAENKMSEKRKSKQQEELEQRKQERQELDQQQEQERKLRLEKQQQLDQQQEQERKLRLEEQQQLDQQQEQERILRQDEAFAAGATKQKRILRQDDASTGSQQSRSKHRKNSSRRNSVIQVWLKPSAGGFRPPLINRTQGEVTWPHRSTFFVSLGGALEETVWKILPWFSPSGIYWQLPAPRCGITFTTTCAIPRRTVPLRWIVGCRRRYGRGRPTRPASTEIQQENRSCERSRVSESNG